MKAVLDTNVFVSGLLWRGTPNGIYQAWQAGKFTLVVSIPILDEYRRILLDLSQGHTSVDIDTVMEAIGLLAQMTEPVRLGTPVCTDPDDDMFIEAALAAQARFIVTGDRALLKVSRFGSIEIVTARQFASTL